MMLRTIRIGSYVFIQGTFVRDLPDGRMIVQVDDKVFTGQPIEKAA